MRLTPLALLPLLALAPPASADQVSISPDPPRVLALYQRERAGDATSDVALYDHTGQETIVLGGIPFASLAFDAHEGTGRWMLVYHQLSEGEPLELGGKAVSKPQDRNTLVVGDLAGVVGHAYGDKACSSKQRACFETPLTWTADGAYVYVQSEGSTWGTVGRWKFGKKLARAAITAKKPGLLSISPEQSRAVYLAKDGVHVVKFPKAKKKPAKVKANKQAEVDPQLLRSLVFPVGDKLYWFRAEPTQQLTGTYEMYDLKTKQTTALLEAKHATYLADGFRSTGPRGTVVFADPATFDHADLYEAAADGTVTKVTGDVLQLLDVSDDGRFALVTKREDPKQLHVVTNPEQLVIVDLVTRRAVQVIDTDGDGTKIVGAGFAPRP